MYSLFVVRREAHKIIKCKFFSRPERQSLGRRIAPPRGGFGFLFQSTFSMLTVMSRRQFYPSTHARPVILINSRPASPRLSQTSPVTPPPAAKLATRLAEWEMTKRDRAHTEANILAQYRTEAHNIRRAQIYAVNELRRAKHEAEWQEFVRARSPNARAAERITRALPVVESAPRTPDDRLRTPLEWPRVAVGRVPILLQGGAHLGGPTHLRDQDPEPGMEIERQRRRPLQMRGRRIQLQLVEINRPHAQYPSLSCVSAS